jgi:short-subunit dehydrogenase
MDLNYYGQVVPILVLLTYFMGNQKGYIANASFVAGFLGQMGYAAYTPSKFAITGLSEVLRHELKPYNIGVSVIFPSDTETPGLQEELESRPQELNIISDSWGGLSTAEEIAEKYVEGVLKKKFNICPSTSAKFIRYVNRLFPRLVHKVSDGDLRKARKKMGKNYKY